MARTLFVLFALISACAIVSAVNVPVEDSDFPIAAPDGSTFRSDYFFHQGANGWVKLHREPATWFQARLTCRLEGARLASPINRGLHSTLRWLKQASRVGSVYTGIHSMSSSTDYVSIEGVHVSQMPIQWAEDQPDNENDQSRCLIMGASGRLDDVNCEDLNAYFCYREKVGTPRMNVCGNSDSGYLFSNLTRSCYKLHTEPATWYQANHVCNAEGGRLVVINSEFEASLVNELRERQTGEYVFVGLVNWFKDDSFDITTWKTIEGQTLEQAGWVGWLPGEPNNIDNDEYCGTVSGSRSGMGYVDYPCSNRAPFICEVPLPARAPVWW